jgi:putative DNA-invertase from lambdoid prophage Rac
MAVYGYCRVSTQQQAKDGESLLVQERHINGWCMQEGLTLERMFVEKGVSGSIPINDRPEGVLLWSLLRRGDTVVAAKLDRLFRSALDALQMVQWLKDHGVSLVLGDLGGDISGNGLSKLFLTIAAAFAEAERDRIRERVTQVKADQKTRGRYLGGKVPFGFEIGSGGDLVPIAAEQSLIEEARGMRAAGKTLRSIQAVLSSVHGRKLSLDAINRITS